MPKTETLKLTEVRKILKTHKRDDLEYIITAMHKMIPKKIKEDNNLYELIQSSEKFKNAKSSKKKIRPFSEVKDEVEFFCKNAYAQNYYAPNRVIKKSDRPKWRFVVNRLYKELVKYSKEEGYEQKSAELLQKIYEVLTYSCAYYLFSTYDSFDSIRITQFDFFNTIISIKEKYLLKEQWIKQTVNLIINNHLNRYTLYSDLIDVFIGYLNIPDLNYLTIKIADEIRKEININNLKNGDYYENEKQNSLTEIVVKCYYNLFEYDNAINYFYDNIIEKEKEVK